jgi:hypothetical protein
LEPVKDLSSGSIREFHSSFCREALDIYVKKNADYAAKGSRPLSNFELPEFLEVCGTQDAIFVRFCDKVSRMANLLKRDPQVTSESFRDTALDAINYIILLTSMRESDD